MAIDRITSAGIADGTIDTADIADNAVTDAKSSLTTTLTGLDDVTINSSDPGRTSNKTPVGHLWLNSTSGETYVLTNATSNANVWKNVGTGTGNIDFPVATGITSSPSDLTTPQATQTTAITFTNGSDDIDNVFDFAIANISNSSVITGAVASGDVTDVASATFNFTLGASVGASSTFDVQITDSGGYTSSKQFTITAAAPTFTVEYFAVAGGGGGGYYGGSAGGAGGMLDSSFVATPSSSSVTVTIGAGGQSSPSGSNANNTAASGSNTTLTGSTTATCIGGGGGRGGLGGGRNGIAGGSGSGGHGHSGTGSGGAGTAGQGNAGGSVSNATIGAGGGGKGGGVATNVRDGGLGSTAFSTWATATSSGVNGGYAGGGGGYKSGGPQGSAVHGGGNYGAAATANTGGGCGSDLGNGAYGGSGIVIFRYSGAAKATGGTIVTTGGYTYHKFTSSGTFAAS